MGDINYSPLKSKLTTASVTIPLPIWDSTYIELRNAQKKYSGVWSKQDIEAMYGMVPDVPETKSTPEERQMAYEMRLAAENAAKDYVRNMNLTPLIEHEIRSQLKERLAGFNLQAVAELVVLSSVQSAIDAPTMQAMVNATHTALVKKANEEIESFVKNHFKTQISPNVRKIIP